MKQLLALAAAACLGSAPTRAQPAEWLADIAAFNKLWAPSDAGIDGDNMPMIGNGHVAQQISSDSLYVAGVFNGYLTTTPSHRARVPAPLNVAAPGTPADSAMDVRQSTYYRRSTIAASAPGACTVNSTSSCSNGGAITVEQRFYAHRVLPSVLVMEVEVLAAASTAASMLQAGAPFAMLKLENAPGSNSGDLNLQPVTNGLPPSAPYTVVAGPTLIPESNSSGLITVAVATSNWPVNNMLQVSGAGVTYTLMAVIRTSLETPGVTPGNYTTLLAAIAADFGVATAYAANGTLHSTHVAEWAATVWGQGIDTDRPDLAAAVNASQHAIIASIRPDVYFGISPGGLTAGYNGHAFWDGEFWMQPTVSLLHPDLANALLQYRLLRLSGAYQKAQSYQPPFSGAMFPWESASTGLETCPSWAATGLREIHINGDIAFSIWYLWRLTQDNSANWVGTQAYPILSGIADFWLSRLAVDNPGAGGPGAGTPLHISGVIPPDEYADEQLDSVFTNAVAILSLQYATAAAKLLGKDNSTYAAWEDAATRIVMVYNATSPVERDSEGHKQQHFSTAVTPEHLRSTLPMDSSGGWHPESFNYTVGTTIKQADTILLGFPLVFSANLTPAVRQNDLVYYGQHTDPNGPAMTWGMHAVGFFELGDVPAAFANFNRSYKQNVALPFQVWCETPIDSSGACHATPNFLTGAGGFLQGVIHGAPGLRVNDTAMTVNPQPLEGATYLRVRGMSYLGNRLTFTYNATSIMFEVQAAASETELAALGAGVRRAYAVEADTTAWASGVVQQLQLQAEEGAAAAAASHWAAAAVHQPLSARSQIGQVLVDGRRLHAQQLVVVDAAGARYPLAQGSPVVLPVGFVAVTAA